MCIIACCLLRSKLLTAVLSLEFASQTPKKIRAVLWFVIYNITLLLCSFRLIVIKYGFWEKVTRGEYKRASANEVGESR